VAAESPTQIKTSVNGALDSEKDIVEYQNPVRRPTIIPETQDHLPQTFVGELNDALMGPGWVAHINGLGYMKQLQEVSLYYGYYVADYDDPFQPIGLSKTEEIALRQAMADSTKSYILANAIPNYIQKKLEKNSAIAATIAITQDVQNVKLFSQKVSAEESAKGVVEPSHPWEVNGGIHPRAWDNFTPKSFESFVRAANGLWSVEFYYVISEKDTRVATWRRLGKYEVKNVYHIENRSTAPTLIYNWNPRTSTSFGLNFPIADPSQSNYTLAVAHSF
jgi:hypothetical protein